jgi:hypothetical protein
VSDNEQKPGKVLRTSSGRTRLTATGDADTSAKSGAGTSGSAPAASSSAGSAPTATVPTGSGPTGGRPAGGQSSGAQGSAGPQTRVSSASGGLRFSGGGDDSSTGSGPDHRGQSSGGVKASSSGVKMSGKSSKKGPRTVRLTIANIDPWSVMKMSFLLSLAIAIAMLVATLVLWLVLQMTGVMGNIESTLSEIAGAESADQLLALVSLGRVMATSFVLALVNIVLMTALSTLFAFLYNIGASIVGGFHLTLTDD